MFAGPDVLKDRAPAEARKREAQATAPLPPSTVEVLRSFDLDSRYGPCRGLGRRERWERARSLGLDPPPEVPGLLEAGGGELDVSSWDELQGKDL